MEQLQQMYIPLGVQSHSRRHIFCAERCITPVYDVFKIGGWYLGRGDVEGEDFVGELFEREVFPCCLPIAGKAWNLFRDEQTAIGGESLQYDFLEGELRIVRLLVRV